ncbi:hypothetical protein [Rhodopseudomonas palustris]|uniref:hypothetical protein n=1 Tax=Rhodopseudomonas palustris TaxID=1076 RepID=UPI00059F9CF8
MREFFRKWWDGEFIPHKNEPNSAVFFVGGTDKRHWTANRARWAVSFYLREWKWVIGSVAAVVGRSS